MSKKNRLVIIDGNALLHRAFHALPQTLTTKNGQPINAVYGFTLILLKCFKDLKPTHWVLTFDRAGPTFRHKMYKKYKAQRKKQPQELYDQLLFCKEIAKVFNIPIFEKEGFEADDLIGTIAKRVSEDDSSTYRLQETIIITGDMDTLQLINDNTKVFTFKRGVGDTIIYDERTTEERFGGLKPNQLIDYKALRGDPSDNIPGVKGIGEKNAIDLIREFGTLENLYKNVNSEKIKTGVREKLKKYKKEAFLSEKLATIATNAPLDFQPGPAKIWPVDRKRVIKLFQQLEFKSLINKIPAELITAPQPTLFNRDELHTFSSLRSKTNDKYHFIKTKSDYENFIKILAEQTEFVIDAETTGLDPRKAKIVGLGFCFKESEAYYIDWKDALRRIYAELKQILENPEIKKIGHNIKYDYSILKTHNIKLAGIYFDTMIASYVINPGRPSGLNVLSFSEFGHQKITTSEILGEKIAKKTDYLPMDRVPPEKLTQYACEDVDYTFRLYKKFAPKIKENNLTDLFYKIEMPLVETLAEMELAGIKIDVELLNRLAEEIDDKLAKIDKEIYKRAGADFNIDSPIQLKEFLFNKLKISAEGLKKTKTGISTAAGELEKIRDKHSIIDYIIQHRELTKLNSTYVKTLPRLISQRTGRVHTNFNQTITATGRLSSSNPNLQNIPIRTEFGQKIRYAFVAESGYKLISADYSQIELRIVASLAGDNTMLKAFKEGKDIHVATAAAINNVPLEEVTKEMRSAAKEVNFGVIYGMGAYGLSARTGIGRQRAKEFIERYFNVYNNVKKYLEKIKNCARNSGYVETFFGRRRYLREINSQIASIRGAAERMAINMPIQGTAADLMKLAMIEVEKMIKEKYSNSGPKSSDKSHNMDDTKYIKNFNIAATNDDVKLILQVHDELILEARECLVEEICEKVKKIMENAHLRRYSRARGKFKVPIVVEIKVGENWGKII